MSSTEVAVRDGGGAVEQRTAHERRMTALYRDCLQLSKSELVPKALRGKADNVFALALYGEQYGLAPVHAVQRIYIIEGSFEPKAEVLAGVVMRAGHELRWDETSSERCTVAIRRAGSQDWQSTTWTLDDARRAGLLDMWVERWVSSGERNRKEVVIVGDDEQGVFTDDERKRRALPPIPDWARKLLDAGDVKRKDPWFQFPGDMLAAKCLRRAAKRITPDALLGIDLDMPFQPMTPETVTATVPVAPAVEDDWDHDDDPPAAAAPAPDADDDPDGGEDETIPDAEIVEPPAAGDDDAVDPAVERERAMKKLMVTCTAAFPETDAPKGTKTARQRQLRHAAQYAVIGEHRSATDLTVEELDAVEKWVWTRFLDESATTPTRYELYDDGRVKFSLGDKSKIVPAPDDTANAA